MRRYPIHQRRGYRRAGSRGAFTLVEALVSITITAMAASVLLLGTTSSLQATDEALKQTIAQGMAQQLMDEVVGARYHAAPVDGYQVTLGPSAYEQQGAERERYDDIGDYNGLRLQLPTDRWGIALGKEDLGGENRHENFEVPSGFFEHWKEEVDVYYVDESDLSVRLPAGQVSDYRAVEVRILYDDPQRGSREMARLRRVVAYVPPLP